MEYADISPFVIKSATLDVEMPDTFTHHTDSELTALLREGNEQAFLELFNRYQPLAYVHAIKKFGDTEQAKDAVQDIFAELWAKRETFNLQGNFGAYLFISIRNRFINLLGHLEVREQYAENFRSFLISEGDRSDTRVRERMYAELIEREISALPEKMREIFILSRKEHLSHKEIAVQLGVSEETVKKQVKNAIKTLRRRLPFLCI
ncbi:ECF RNA polymerase sigma factor RpoE [compost metagenome]